MNTDWQEKLAGLGSSLDIATSSNAPVAQIDGPAVVDLSPMAVVDLTGPDAKEFLQNQVCNDLSVMSGEQIQLNGYCNPKGRLLALFIAYTHLDGYRLLLPELVAASMLKRLQMFVLRAEVTITHRTDLVVSGVVTDVSASPELPAPFASVPNQVLSKTGDEHAQVLRWHDSSQHARYLCVGEADTVIKLWQDSQFVHTTYSYWRWGDINAGMPNVFASSVEQFIPQMLNMQLVDGLSFKKGCYPGQEIVARMQYLGKLKKHMKHLHAKGLDKAPDPGHVLTTESNNNAGQVVDAIVDEHGVNLLAVVNKETPVSELKLQEQSLTEAPMPYSLNPDSAATE